MTGLFLALLLSQAAEVSEPFLNPRIVDFQGPEYGFISARSEPSFIIHADGACLVLEIRLGPSGKQDDYDSRCVVVYSRDCKHGWLIDRQENTAVRVENQTLPEWCSTEEPKP